MNLKCDNCDYVCTDGNANLVKDLLQRVESGGIMPGGECPECGALMYPTQDKPKKVRMRLILDVEYAPHGTTKKCLTDMLKAIGDRAANDGLMTDDTPAEVEMWTAHVEEVK